MVGADAVPYRKNTRQTPVRRFIVKTRETSSRFASAGIFPGHYGTAEVPECLRAKNAAVKAAFSMTEHDHS